MSFIVATERKGANEPGLWVISPKEAIGSQLTLLTSAAAEQKVISKVEAQALMANIALRTQASEIPLRNDVCKTFSTALSRVNHNLYVDSAHNVVELSADSPKRAKTQVRSLYKIKDTLCFTPEGLAADLSEKGEMDWLAIDPKDMNEEERIPSLLEKDEEADGICGAFGINIEWSEDPTVAPQLLTPWGRDGTPDLFNLLGRIGDRGDFVAAYDSRP